MLFLVLDEGHWGGKVKKKKLKTSHYTQVENFIQRNTEPNASTWLKVA